MSKSHDSTAPHRRNKRILALRGSRGGSGTSMIATNLGIFLAQIGKRVLLVDACLSGGDMHSWLGDLQPERFITQVLDGELAIEKAATATAITGLYLLAGPPGIQTMTPTQEQTIDFISQIDAVDADFVILDLPVDFNPFTLELFCSADYPILVTLPLPAAVENSYRFITAAWFHQLKSSDEIESSEAKTHIRDMLQHAHTPKTPREFTEVLRHLDDTAYEKACDLSSVFHPQLIINQIKIREDGELGKSMVSAMARWLGINGMELGTIGWDDNVWLAQRRSRVLLTEFARSQACKDLEQIVRKVMSLNYSDLSQRIAVPPPAAMQNYYELLEIYPGASEEEIRRAYKQIQSWFGVEGMAVRGAATETERTEFEQLVEQAHARLLDRSIRREYDRANFPEGFTPSVASDVSPRDSIAGTVTVTQESLPTVKLRDGDVVDGAFLATLRKERQVELSDISNRAKVSVRYLKAIEEERFDDLPAAVFTRGFVMEFARFLKVDPRRAVQDFMQKYDTRMKKKSR